MANKSFFESLQAFGINRVLDYFDSNPEENMHKVLKWVEVVGKGGDIEKQLKMFKKIVNDPTSNWYQLILDFWSDRIHPDVRRKFFENFIIHATAIGTQRQKKAMAAHNCNIPWAILMDPTSACNLKCTGCWAAEYGHTMSMSYETLDSIVEQGKELGTFMYIFSGGEPLTRKKDILRLCEKHNECMFLSFTNGTLIDEEFCDEMLRVKNFIPAISVEGFEEATDSRRGKGTFQAVSRAMDLLKAKQLPFGVSCCYTRYNTDVIGSEEYYDWMIDKGAMFCWFFTYMPVGQDASVDLIATPEQREFMFHRVREFRNTKKLFTLDFWNDGQYIKGCIAGGRYYLHINANGDIEPCAFIHYSDTNIHEHTLLEAYKNPLFTQYRQSQPFNENHHRPCPMFDNPTELERMVKASGAHSTEALHPEDVSDLCAKCKRPAELWAPVADRLWEKTLQEYAAMDENDAMRPNPRER
ncbi:MAG: radical SAM protein [Clostridia bacterium]|nr:radical SAM protein [Clostridia bacterium]